MELQEGLEPSQIDLQSVALSVKLIEYGTVS